MQEPEVMNSHRPEITDDAGEPAAVPELCLPEFVLAQASQRDSKRALVDASSGVALTYAELAVQVAKISARLTARGVGRGDVLALCAPNSIEFAVMFLAATSAGAAVTTVNPLWTEPEISRQLRQAGVRWLVSTDELLASKLRDAVQETGMAGVFPIGEVVSSEVPTAADRPAASTMASSPAVAPADRQSAAEPALLLSSSGTTGLPKMVVLTHGNLVTSLCQTRLVHKVTADDVVLVALPLFHIFALQVSLNLGLLEGATVVILPRFELGSFLRAVDEYRVTRAELVPPMVLSLASTDLTACYDLSSLRVLTSGAAPLGGELALACARRIGCRVKQMYGLTETGGASHTGPDDGPDRPDSIGPALPGVECRIIDPGSGADTPTEEPGELLIRTGANMRGYLGDPVATAATIDADGWLHTGDIVTVDGDGWYRVADRVKELIKYKGMSVAPAELEALLLTHPAVADAAVVRHPDDTAGEVPKAYVVRRDDLTERELIDWLADQVASYKQVRIVEFTDSIPKSPSGKILRRLLVTDGTGVAPTRPARP
jgi:acyl-CoA synthetase (AMP-forming)/AMP-acid ligase II